MRLVSSLKTPLRSRWSVAGNDTETLWWPVRNATCLEKKKKKVLLFIPGNPGLVEYYTDFLEEIHQNASLPLEIFAVSNLGMIATTTTTTANNNKDDGLFSLQEQIDHKIACFDILYKESPDNTEFALMGHSIGAYIAVEVLKKRHSQRIHRVVTLFPTIREIGLTPNGITFTKLFSYLPISVISTSATLLSYMSAPLLERLVMLLTGQQGPCAQVTAHRLLKGSVVKNCLYMAQQEMQHVGELDLDFYNAHADKFVIYYSRNDKWAPLDHYEYMKQRFPEHEHLYLCQQDIPHSFSLEPKNSSYMANKVVSWLEQRH
ncbi:hypothetical protein BDB00DRAFT_807703 [Zychaea mexicana]|uniref:uncharacterized protein n=1 Tax=Zychaea mexicana TaxID=64656 RepID=UPI0022FF149C|nr:uncharacterized protein BDB00DRAFT_807703 [Zychaea mexicana]KAI9496891.1 hypothetical protein BDB00DRAFT_807703 [Zychaea mexicana]